mmetsp:Transcript_21480/g.54047  ORF Transcript_21480/g.54047 Transcript_21480/m.54047 type:complete len:276 (-) Transcript_21480:520-1347(-)
MARRGAVPLQCRLVRVLPDDSLSFSFLWHRARRRVCAIPVRPPDGVPLRFGAGLLPSRPLCCAVHGAEGVPGRAGGAAVEVRLHQRVEDNGGQLAPAETAHAARHGRASTPPGRLRVQRRTHARGVLECVYLPELFEASVLRTRCHPACSRPVLPRPWHRVQLRLRLPLLPPIPLGGAGLPRERRQRTHPRTGPRHVVLHGRPPAVRPQHLQARMGRGHAEKRDEDAARRQVLAREHRPHLRVLRWSSLRRGASSGESNHAPLDVHPPPRGQRRG